MLDVNSYFDGKVKSIGFQGSKLPATVGVMDVGKYTFGTSQRETMTVVSGQMIVQLPDTTEWQTYIAGEYFVVAANTSFDLQVPEQTAYLCTYG